MGITEKRQDPQGIFLKGKTFLSRIVANKITKGLFQIVLDAMAQDRFSRLGAFAHFGSGSTISQPWNCIDGVDRIHIGDRFHANTGLFLGAYGDATGDPQIVIGNDVIVNYDCQITAVCKVEVGDEVLFGSRVLITDHLHGAIDSGALSLPPIRRKLYSKGPVSIGNRVWIGSGVVVLPGVSIGDNCIIGANSVVTRSFGPGSVIAGAPARLVRELADES